MLHRLSLYTWYNTTHRSIWTAWNHLFIGLKKKSTVCCREMNWARTHKYKKVSILTGLIKHASIIIEQEFFYQRIQTSQHNLWRLHYVFWTYKRKTAGTPRQVDQRNSRIKECAWISKENIQLAAKCWA